MFQSQLIRETKYLWLLQGQFTWAWIQIAQIHIEDKAQTLVGAIVFFYACEQGISEQYWRCYELSMAGSFPCLELAADCSFMSEGSINLLM